MTETELLHCYNKGCGQKFDPKDNKEGSCWFHPGGPIFHDALKGWSCCKKRSTDFTEFLSIKGCTSGLHNDVKPPEPVKEDKPRTELKDEILIYQSEPKPLKPEEPSARPSESEPMITLKNTVTHSLKQLLDKQMAQLNVQDDNEASDSGAVKVGTCCKNSGCQYRYTDETSLTHKCIYHTGSPIFHEGMKYWSCCERKTSDFDNFLAQEGCTTGSHVWHKKESAEQKVACRYDWHQTPGFVTMSIFSKVADPEKTVVKVNRVTMDISIIFENGKSNFSQKLALQNVIDPSRSNVKMMGTKVEINLKKASPGSWSRLELKQVAS